MSESDTKVPEYDYDHTSTKQMENPYPLYAEMRSRCPVGHTTNHGGFYPVVSYRGVKRVFSEYKTFSSNSGVGIPPQTFKMHPIDTDPPEQTRLRKVLNPLFTEERFLAMCGHIQGVCDGLIDAFIERGEAELGEELIRPMLATVVLPIIGVPLEDRKMVGGWTDTLARERGTHPDRVEAAGAAIISYLTQLSASRRNMPRGNDVLSILFDTKFDGEALTDDYIWTVLIITLLGGLDTTSAVMMEGVIYFSENPEAAARLLSGQLDWGVAIEELIRYTSPVQGLGRIVAQDTELEGVRLRRGEWVMGVLGAANHDPAQFSRPDEIVLDRVDNEHIGFGAGAHICLGRNLARIELKIFFETILKRMPDIKPIADFKPEFAVGEARGMKSLPVTFTPGRRLADVHKG